MSIGFWIRIRGGRYILSTGSYTNSTKGTGFQIIYNEESKSYEAYARSQKKFWMTKSPAHRNTWCYVMITWSEQYGLRFYLDSKLMATDYKGSEEEIVVPL